MNTNQFARTRLIFGKDNMEKLYQARVIVFGIGGVGSYVVESLVRSGIGAIDIVDDDKICLTNLNRQLYALHSTIGKDKVDVAEERIHDINPDCKVTKWKTFYMPDTAGQFDFSQYDYIVDCIDTVTGKLEIISRAKAIKKPVISCMGAGNKVDPTKLKVADITRTSVCPLARVMRNELKKRHIKRLKVVFSTETAIAPQAPEADSASPDDFKDTSGITPARQGISKKQTPGSNAFVPSVAGMIIAAEVVKDLTQFHVTDLFKE
ncbi:ThiF family adenylyltransferase [Treponema bryantii]|uniref:tRNA threonylcarbamoyladenosine dehydratase n=1 Tax=Treponema bryantii TaxID=163 RepID=UPI0003B6B894|nr:tRNA threonylcarbamoyladenosine dehydratase [Treponema bryantii]